MSDEADELAKSLGKALTGATKLMEGIFYIALAALAAYALTFAYAWVVAHPKQTLITTCCVALWLTRAIIIWRK